MSLLNAIIKTGCTWAPTGGTDVTFVPDGRQVSDGVSLVVAADTNLLTRRTLVAKATLPALPANANAYAKLQRGVLTYKIPMIAADGKLYQQTVAINTSFHPETTDSAKAVILTESVSFLADADFLNFWKLGLLS